MSTAKQDIIAVEAAAEKEPCLETSVPRKAASFRQLLLRFIVIYWRSIVVITWPIVLSPIIIYNNERMYRCLYVVAMMAVYWVTEALPLPITSLMPIFLYPIMGILSTTDTTKCYLNDTTMMFLASLIIAVAIEHSGLHMRVAFLIIKVVGCGHRRLSFGIFLVTMFISMWISNTAATAMMIPIINTVLMEMENQGLGAMFIEDKDDFENAEGGEPAKKPTRATMTYYMIASYASSIGGTGTVVGSGTNLTFKGLYEGRFPHSPGINFSEWMCYAVPPMLICGFLIWIWLQIMYMGMFRPNSKDAQDINIGREGEKIAENVIQQKYKDLGPITWHESCVAILFVLVIFMWFFRKPGFVPGWPTYITSMPFKDSSSAIFVTLLMFIIPANLDFLNSFSKDPSKRPTKPTPGLISWKLIQTRMHWGLMFVLGGGFALSVGSTDSGLSTLLGNALTGLRYLHPVVILFIVCFMAEMITELTSNVAIANIILPILAELCVSIKLHPLYLMLPASLCCSFSFHLPVGTPPNAIATAAGHIKTKDLVIAGIGPSVITLIVLTIGFPTWGSVIYDLHEFPDWANMTMSTKS
ncbi:protein I'm not dead yet-like [Neodiprion lecontei]|uniref:Protein I'm not dead yet-like n=1 Tax=Neodiprion lecontei TaxID=441921 RepID=A0ABM3FT76_NEOLC|nr:protein I'm not dead yet-like [Neodiprion lecontei]XP_046591218.1 protein I'm not dead yet-like [Neodiprion lecontei]